VFVERAFLHLKGGERSRRNKMICTRKPEKQHSQSARQTEQTDEQATNPQHECDHIEEEIVFAVKFDFVFFVNESGLDLIGTCSEK
jgi:hypothetical protein